MRKLVTCKTPLDVTMFMLRFIKIYLIKADEIKTRDDRRSDADYSKRRMPR